MEQYEQNQFEREIDAAQKAESLHNKFLKDFFAQKKGQLFEAFSAAPIGDTETLISIHMALKSMASLEGEINSIINTGKMAKVSMGLQDTATGE